MIELLKFTNVKKIYNVKQGIFSKPIQAASLSDVNFTIYDDSTLSIVGESGSGKTTTTRLVLGLEKPSGGTIKYKDKDITKFSKADIKQYRRKVQAVFQDPYSSLDPYMTIENLLKETLTINTDLSKKEIDYRIDSLLDSVGIIPEHKKRYQDEFSGGQRQRLSIARAIALEPELLVLDEPISALDVSIRGQILNLFKDLQKKQHISYLFISHDLASVRYISDYIAVMYFGKIVEYGKAETIFENPKHPYTKALLKAGMVKNVGENFEQHILEGEIPSILDPPTGCPFHSRCKSCHKLCLEKEPWDLQIIEKDHYAACHLFNDFTI